jgi:hypothetical protein
MVSQDKDIRKFEEVNSFSEKIADGVVHVDDDSDVIVWDPDDGIIPTQKNTYDEIAPLTSVPRRTEVIVDEVPSLQPPFQNDSVKVGLSDIEDLALEIDAMELPKNQSETSQAKDDFLAALDDEQVNFIDEIVDQSISEYELEPVDTFGSEDEGAETALFLEERLIESKPLWSDDDDFWIIDAEGFGVPPHELFAFISSGGNTAVSAAEEIPATVSAVSDHGSSEDEEVFIPVANEPVVPLPFADKPYILKSSDDEIFIDVAELIDPAIKEESSDDKLELIEDYSLNDEAVSSSSDTIGEESSIVIVEPHYLSEDESTALSRKVSIDDDPDRRTIESASFSYGTEAGKKENVLPEEKVPDAKSRLPEDFTINHIDLDEAEIIAQEDIFLLSEEDLIEELEQIDLHPLENEIPPAKKNIERSEYKSDSLKSVAYITPQESALDERLRSTLESEIAAQSALIIEEDVRDIRRKLDEYA